MTQNHGIDRDRLSVLTGALVLGLALGRFLDVPLRPISTSVLGSQLDLYLSATSVMMLIMGGMAITGTESLVRSHPLARQGELGRSFMFWILPTLLVLGLGAWLNTMEDAAPWALALLIGSILIALALAGEYHLVHAGRDVDTRLLWAQLVLVHLVAFMLFSRIYELRARSILSGTAVLLVTTLLAARLFWPMVDRPAVAFIYAAVPGMLLGQLTWVLNYLPLTTLQGGLILLIAFYAVVGLLQQFLSGRFERRVVLEYVGVTVVTLLVVTLAIR
jgi:hypothetical protein